MYVNPNGRQSRQVRRGVGDSQSIPFPFLVIDDGQPVLGPDGNPIYTPPIYTAGSPDSQSISFPWYTGNNSTPAMPIRPPTSTGFSLSTGMLWGLGLFALLFVTAGAAKK